MGQAAARDAGTALGWASAQLGPGWARWWPRAGPGGSQALGQCRRGSSTAEVRVLGVGGRWQPAP